MDKRLMPATLCLSLAFLAGAAPARARLVRTQGFEDAIREGYLGLREAERALLPQSRPPLGPKAALRTSARLFSAAPAAGKDLAHLRGLLEGEASAADSPETSEQGDDILDAGDDGLDSLLRLSLFWHEAQRSYDRKAPTRDGVARYSGKLPLSVEMERRAWQAACTVWKAGIAARRSLAASEPADADPCDRSFPAVYYCRLYFDAEIVVMTAGMAREGSPGSPFENLLASYCADYERSERGNPLSLEGLRLQWSAEECVDKAVNTLLDPGWKSSTELCPAEHGPGPDLRRMARELEKPR